MPNLRQIPGVAGLAAAKFITEVAGVGRFKEAVRALTRRLSDVVCRAMVADLEHATSLATVMYRPAAT